MPKPLAKPPDPGTPQFKDWVIRLWQAVTAAGSGNTHGTWTPVLTFVTPGNLNVVYSFQLGESIDDGVYMTLIGFIQTSTFTFTTASGELRITGIPANADATGPMFWTGSCSFQGITKASYTQYAPQISSTVADQLRIFGSGSAQNLAALTTADLPTGGTVSLRFQITYKKA